MLSASDNRLLTEVGAGTPCGELLRRYWHPVGVANEITPNSPKKKARLLGEDLVLYRTVEGNYGLVQERCVHRGASLFYGYAENTGIRCAYHGWLYDTTGTCKEQPFEENTEFRKAIRQPSYAVEQLAGILFAYLGPPDRKPLLPHWDILVRAGTRTIRVVDDLRCNWLQVQEDSADVTHTHFLHGRMFAALGIKETSGFARQLKEYGFQPFKWGILKSWRYDGAPRRGWGNPLIFPNMLRLPTEMLWRVPLDDHHTRIFWLTFSPSAVGELRDPDAELVIKREPSWVDESGNYVMTTFLGQDAMAAETPGVVFDRTSEHLGTSDRGVVMFRQMLRREIEIVKEGGDPMALVWDPATNVMIDLRECIGGDSATSSALDNAERSKDESEVFDDRHEIYRVSS